MASDENLDYNFLLVGITGAGKSSTGNTILLSDKARFKAAATTETVTQTVQEEYGKVMGRIVKVVDVPGLADSEKNDENAIRHVAEQIDEAVRVTPDGYDAIIIVITFGRLTKEDMVVVNQLKGIFGENFVAEYGVLLITRCGDFDPEETGVSTIEEWCSNQTGLLERLRRECRGRVVFFENRHAKIEEKNVQVEQLFQTVEKIKYGPKRYTPDLFKKVQEERDRLLLSATEVYLPDDIRKKIALMRQELHRETSNNPAENIPRLKETGEDAQKLIIEVKKLDKGTGKLGDVVATLEVIIKSVDQQIAIAEARIEQSRLQDSISNMEDKFQDEKKKLLEEMDEKDENCKKMKEEKDKALSDLNKKYQDMMSQQQRFRKISSALEFVSTVTNILGGATLTSHNITGTVKGAIETHRLLRK